VLTYEDYHNVDLETDVMETTNGQFVALREVPLPEMISFRNSVASQDDWVLADYLRQFVPEVFLNNLGAGIVHSLDATLNSVGIEAAIRTAHETLSHLDAHAFAYEITLARTCEALRPGYLRKCAIEQGMDAAYEEAEQHVAKAVVEVTAYAIEGWVEKDQEWRILSPINLTYGEARARLEEYRELHGGPVEIVKTLYNEEVPA